MADYSTAPYTIRRYSHHPSLRPQNGNIHHATLPRFVKFGHPSTRQFKFRKFSTRHPAKSGQFSTSEHPNQHRHLNFPSVGRPHDQRGPRRPARKSLARIRDERGSRFVDPMTRPTRRAVASNQCRRQPAARSWAIERTTGISAQLALPRQPKGDERRAAV